MASPWETVTVWILLKGMSTPLRQSTYVQGQLRHGPGAETLSVLEGHWKSEAYLGERLERTIHIEFGKWKIEFRTQE